MADVARSVRHGHRRGPVRRPAGPGPVTQVRVALLVLAGVALLVAAFLLLAQLSGEQFAYFAKEPAETLDQPRYIGWFAYAIVLISGVGAVSALFGGLVLARLGDHDGGAFLAVGGLIASLLLVDDFFQLHESVYPALGFSEHAGYAGYLLMLAGWLGYWRYRVLAGDVLLLLLAGTFLAGSLAVDFWGVPEGWNFHVVEDGAKAAGLAMLAAYLVRAAARHVLEHARTAGAPARARSGETGRHTAAR